jgi:hypothetical protein
MQSDPGFGAAPGRDDDLVEKVARAIADILLEDAFEGDAASEWRRVAHIARAALSVARPAIKEECVDAVFEVGDHASASAYADAIRAME